MTPIASEDLRLKTLPLGNVISYILKSGWKHVSHPNPNLIVFQGASDDLGQPIQLVLPQSHALWDGSILLARVINLLAEIEKRTPEEILREIQLDSEDESVSSATTGLTVKDFIQGQKRSAHSRKREEIK